MSDRSLFSDLITWYGNNRRILPWREDPTPFHVWLSEIMLQQTRVEAVRGYYERFLKAIPDIESLAAAEEETVLKLWEGLGYYSRARNLRRAAQVIMEKYDGQMPDTAKDLAEIPGIGPYTAAAIASISYGKKEAAVDGNLLRVFSRMTAYGEDIKRPEAKKAAEKFFLRLMELPDSCDVGFSEQKDSHEQCRNIYGDFNQALMDLGATICLPNSEPHCGECPWSEHCRAHLCGEETSYPIMPEKKKRKTEEKTVLLIRYNNRYVVHRRPSEGLLAGLYEFPMADGTLTEEEALQEGERIGFSALRIRKAGEAKHIFTHKEWHMTGYEITADELAEAFDRPEKGEADPAYILADREEILTRYPVPSALSKYKKYVLSRIK